MLQEPKELIDIGEIGNTSTGDILYDGGDKLNKVINALYSVLGDYRLNNLDQGIGKAILHATGYYQKHPRSYYTQSIDIGSMHDINTNDGTITVRLPRTVLGEGVEIVNLNGSVSEKLRLIITPHIDDDIDQVAENLIITKPFARIKLFCSSKEGTRGIWSYKAESLFGDTVIALQGTYAVNGNRSIRISDKNEFESMKFIISGKSPSGFKASELIVFIDNDLDAAPSTEYGVIKSGDDIYQISFSVDNDVVYMNIATQDNTTLTIKSIESVKPGVAK